MRDPNAKPAINTQLVEEMKLRAENKKNLNTDKVNIQEALEEAIYLAEEGWSYAPEYFKTKWKAESRLKALRIKAGVEKNEPLPIDRPKRNNDE